mgnify:CR=1 FL=1
MDMADMILMIAMVIQLIQIIVNMMTTIIMGMGVMILIQNPMSIVITNKIIYYVFR